MLFYGCLCEMSTDPSNKVTEIYCLEHFILHDCLILILYVIQYETLFWSREHTNGYFWTF